MEEMNRYYDQGLGLRWDYIMMFLFCTDLFLAKKGKTGSISLFCSPRSPSSVFPDAQHPFAAASAGIHLRIPVKAVTIRIIYHNQKQPEGQPSEKHTGFFPAESSGFPEFVLYCFTISGITGDVFMLGTLINTGAIIAGGLFGAISGKLIRERHQETLTMACGVGTLFIAMAGAMNYMLHHELLPGGGGMLVVACLALGGLIGEILNIERLFERFGEWLKQKTGNAKDQGFVNGFVTASLTVCIGAMAIMGALQDGISGDWSILGAKAILDLIIIMVMTCSLGKGCVFSAVPVFLWEGGLTLLAGAIRPVMTDQAMGYLSLVGSVVIFCVGINLVWGKKIRVANLLPAVFLAVAAAFLPVQF